MNAKGRARDAETLGPDVAGSTLQSKAAPTSTATVLVVDDDEAVRDSTAAVLRMVGLDVLEAADGAAATWTLASENVDVLLLDLHLGRQDGTAVLEALEETSVAVIFSGFRDFDETDIRRDFGPVVFECLRKPVPPQRLVEVVLAAATHAHGHGHAPRVRPIAPRAALRLAMAGLAHLQPEPEDDAGDPA